MRFLIFLFFIVLTFGCIRSASELFSLGDDVSVKSPNGKLIANSGVTSKTLLLIDVVDVDSGAIFASVNTNVSRIHRWSLKWIDDQTILIRSSDIGPITINMQPDNTWKIGCPLRTPSPDNRFVSYSYSSNNHLKVSLLRVHGEIEDASRVAVRFDSQLEITDYDQLEFCLTWVGNTRLEAKIGTQTIGWNEKPDGSWQADDGTTYELIQ